LYKHPTLEMATITPEDLIRHKSVQEMNNATVKEAFDNAWIHPVVKPTYAAQAIGKKGWPTDAFTPEQLEFMEAHVNEPNSEWINYNENKAYWMHRVCGESVKVRQALNRLFLDNQGMSAEKANARLKQMKEGTGLKRSGDTISVGEPMVESIRQNTAVFPTGGLGGHLGAALSARRAAIDPDDWDTAHDATPVTGGVGELSVKVDEPVVARKSARLASVAESKEAESKKPGWIAQGVSFLVGSALTAAPLTTLTPPTPTPAPAPPASPAPAPVPPPPPAPPASPAAPPASPAPPVGASVDPEVTRLTRIIEQLNKDAQEMATINTKYAKENEKLSKDVADLTASNQYLKQSMETVVEGYEQDIHALKDAVLARDGEINGLRHELFTLGNTVKTKEVEYGNLEKLSQIQRAKITELNSMLNSPTGKISLDAMKVRELEGLLAQKEEDLADSTGDFERLSAAYTLSEQEKQALTQRVKELEGHGASASMQVMLAGLSDQVDRLTLERNELLERMESPVAFKPRHVSRQDSAFGSRPPLDLSRQNSAFGSRPPLDLDSALGSFDAPVTGQDSREPMTRQDSREPMTRQFTREPMTHQFTSEPMTRQDSRQPMTRFDSRASVQPMTRQDSRASVQPMTRSCTEASWQEAKSLADAQKFFNKTLKKSGRGTGNVDPEVYGKFLDLQAAKRH